MGGNVALDGLSASLGKLNVVLTAFDGPSGEPIEADISVLLVDDAGSVPSNESFVFYNQPTAFGGAVHLRDALRDDERKCVVSMITLSLDDLPDEVQRVVVVASIDPSAPTAFDLSGGLSVTVQDADAQDLIAFAVPQPSTERALLFGEFYRRNGAWKFRAIGQGYANGLGAVATEFGVEVAEEEDLSEAADSAEAQHQDEIAPADDPLAEEVDEPPAPTVSVRRSVRPPRMPRDWNKTMPTSSGDLQPSRLFPVAGIGGPEEQERRATSAFLAVLSMVRPFGRAILGPLGAPAGSATTFVEVPFSHKEEAYRPDGLIVVKRGQKTWRALVEVKTGSNDLGLEQVHTYLDIAREQGFDAVITISNQLPVADAEHPLPVDRRKLRKVKLAHVAWDEVRSVATLALAQDFPDPTQKVVLREFLRYMDHDRSGLHGFNDMGKRWAQVRDSSKTKTLRMNDVGTVEIVDRFDQLMQHTALRLGDSLGVRVRSTAPDDAPDQASRRQQLVDSGVLYGSLRVPGAIGKLIVRVDIRTDSVSVTMIAPAPKTGRADTKIRWLLRQIPDASETARVESVSSGARPHVHPALLSDVRQDPKMLVHPDGREAKEFRLTYSARMGAKRAAGTGTLIGSVVDLVRMFYADVAQNITK